MREFIAVYRHNERSAESPGRSTRQTCKVQHNAKYLTIDEMEERKDRGMAMRGLLKERGNEIEDTHRME